MIGKVLKNLLEHQPNLLDKFLKPKKDKKSKNVRQYNEPWVSGQLNYVPIKKKIKGE
jgi:hypothetical protein